MKAILSATAILLLLYSCDQRTYLQSETVQLSPPTIEVEDYFFSEGTQIRVGKTQQGSRVHYTTNDDSLTLQSPVAEGPLNINESQTLTFRTIGGSFLPSAPITVEVLKLSPTLLTLTSASPASPPYNKVPQSALTDRSKAGKNFRQENWLGYQDSLLTFEFSLSGGPTNGIGLSVLEDQGSWIFAPKAIKATFYDAAGQQVASGRTAYPAEVEKSTRSFRFLRIEVEEVQAVRVRLEVENLLEIPDWHSGKGSPPWVFLDEVFGAK